MEFKQHSGTLSARECSVSQKRLKGVISLSNALVLVLVFHVSTLKRYFRLFSFI